MRTTLRSQFTSEQRATCHPKIIARNTFRFTRDGETVIRLHATDVARKLADGSVILNSGGWKTVTTKDRMNSALPPGYCLSQAKGEWWIEGHGARVPFFDGIRVPQNVIEPKAKGAATLKREQRDRAMIRAFCNKLDKLAELPRPSAGDCWYCSMQTQDGKSLGDAIGRDDDHIRQHVKEGYLHGSLILNAIKWAGYRDPAFIFMHGPRSSIKRALKRYLYRKLGLVS